MLVRHIRDTFKLHPVRQLTRIASGALLMACIVGATTSNAQTTSVQDLVRLGTTSFNGAGAAADGTSVEIPRIETDRDFHNIGAPSHPGAPANAADPPGNSIVTPPADTVPGFIGLSHFDQRTAGTGAYANTQFSLEPPDQGLCAGNGFVVETINTAIRVYSATTLLPVSGVMAINQFFKLTPEIIRSAPLVFGDFTSDPKCLYDADTGRFFLTVLQLDVDPATGAFTGPSSVLIAVSQTSDPTKGWNLFKLITTDDGTHGTVNNPNCPCFGDQPLLGLNPDGFFITTNEFPQFVNGFNGAQVYGMSKSNLAQSSGSLPKVVHINAGTIPAPDGGTWYTLQPATPPPGASAGKGQLKNTEFFMSALDFNATLDNRIAVWSLFNTSALVSGNPAAVKLDFTIVATETYGQPPPARQKLAAPGTTVNSQPQLLNTNDDRMNQVVYADGLLYSGVNTILGSGRTERAGIAYFIVAPSIHGHSVSASIAKQGYVSATGNDVLFPSIGVNKFGAGVMSFTLAGPDYWPSGAYAKVNSATGAGAITISRAGVGAEDGFTAAGDDGVARWGDYSAAYADENGIIWIGTECIPGGPRTALANWGTCISPVVP